MKNIVVRAMSGAVYVALIVGAILAGSPWFYALTVLFLVVGLWEYNNMTAVTLDSRPSTTILVTDYIGALAVMMMAFVPWNYKISGAGFVLVFLWIVVRLCLTVLSTSPNALRFMGRSALGIIYLAVPLMLVNIMYIWLGDYGMVMVLLTFVCIWINDTGAFLVGSRMGRRRLCERLSPKKSWEGFWGGMVLVIIAVSLYGYFTLGVSAILPMAVYGVLVSVLATIGDLFESLLKRTAGVKDSGRLIPGHGGILDRIDSFLFAQYALFFLSLMRVLD